MRVLLVVSLSLVLFVGLMGVMKMRKKEHEKDAKQYRLQDIKLRVTNDLVDEFQSELSEKRNQMMKIQGLQTQMKEQVEQLEAKAEKTKEDTEQCQGDQKSASDQLAMAEATLNDLKATSTKEMTEWKAEMDALRKQLAEQSSICDFLKEQTDLTSKLCEKKDAGQEQNAAAPQKEAEAPAPKQEEAPKKEAEAPAPKQEEANAEAPK